MSLVLFGAGAAGSYVLRHLRAQGIEPHGFVDSNESKWFKDYCGLPVLPWEKAIDLSPDASWICCAISRPAATEIRRQLKAMGVRTKPLYECLPVFHENPTRKVQQELIDLCADAESVRVLEDLYDFRANPDYERQRDPSPISELYFPNFIKHRDDEVFVDCGACDGDTVRDFISRWPKYESIIAFEPDPQNSLKLGLSETNNPKFRDYQCAVSDYDGYAKFTANGDYSSHIGDGTNSVLVCTLDKFMGSSIIPTYIKFDIEGAELEALWGARKILKDHSPILAICAYHTSEHTWQIPLLVHAINPSYSLYIRRYAEGAFEIVWYAVPRDRIK